MNLRAHVVLVVLVVLAGAACKKSSPTGPSTNLPPCCFSQSGTGDTVFTVPDHVTTARITGAYTGFSSNFAIWIGPAGSACDVQINPDCRLLVNELIGTGWGTTSYSAVKQTGGGGLAQIVSSTGVAWTFTEQR